jgi:hypothetical protein
MARQAGLKAQGTKIRHLTFTNFTFRIHTPLSSVFCPLPAAAKLKAKTGHFLFSTTDFHGITRICLILKTKLFMNFIFRAYPCRSVVD